MELSTYSDLTSFIGEAFPYYRTWQSFTFLFWVVILSADFLGLIALYFDIQSSLLFF